MSKPIHLDVVKPGREAPHRPNLFAGRHLGERDFDLLQAYADDRLAPLLSHLNPGIVSGLEAGLELDPSRSERHLFHLRPGNAVGGDGRPLRLHYRLEQTWQQLREYVETEQSGPLEDGLYFLHLDRAIELADTDDDALPCTRTEADPLQDRRIETVTLLGLRLITSDPAFLALPQTRAANRLCARFLEESPFDSVNGGVPLALLKVTGRAPVWFDAVAGRYAATVDSPYRTFLAHAQSALEQYSRELARSGKEPDPKVTLADQLGLDFLPAAGPLPAELLRDPGSEEPKPGFDPRDLQIDLIPIPASTVASVVSRELPRGMIDLVHGRSDRMRLLLAVSDPDYRPGLMDLPQPDLALESELAARSDTAIAAWKAWKTQWLALFSGLTEQQAAGLAVPALPKDEAKFLQGLTARHCIDQVVAQRQLSLKGSALPHPYVDWEKRPRLGLQSPAPVPVGEDGLHRKRLALEAEIDALEGELEENFALMNLINDFLSLQRQHLDAITVSFSSLAGGVPGDGSGMNLIRWAKFADFQPKLPAQN